MPARAFVPVPLVEAQPRVYGSFRGRQMRGIGIGLAGAALSLYFIGANNFLGYGLTFIAALPGFAYGYYQPQGKPLEYWLVVLVRFHFTPQRVTASPQGLMPVMKGRLQAIKFWLRAVLVLLTHPRGKRRRDYR
jgi:hypothetical protein